MNLKLGNLLGNLEKDAPTSITAREWRRTDCIPRLSTLAHQAAG